MPGSRDKLIQVFLNLVKNAAEAIGEERADGQITLTTSFRPGVRLSVPGSQARVSLPLEIAVEDNGAGVPPDLMPHLFDPFVTTKPSGTGLGLGPRRQDRRRSRRHHRMRLAAQADCLPNVDAHVGERSGARQAGLRQMAKGNILIADDDAAIRTVLNQALARAGYAPRATGNAATLWRWISQGDGDLVITDVLMPDENAFDLIPARQEAASRPADHRHERAEHLHDGDHRHRAGRLRISAEAFRSERAGRRGRPRARRTAQARRSGSRPKPAKDCR